MQMQQIRYFLALCEEGSFTRAAKRSGVTQPSLTNAISALERELGGPLFERKQFTPLTALGYAIRPHLQRIAETTDHALKTAQAFARAHLARAGRHQ
jgi:LysR family hydrogen peroxide-inducible transcriptional activator